MKDYEIIGWPDIQKYMDLRGFTKNSALIIPNEHIGIQSCTFLVSKEWLESLGTEVNN